MQFSLDTKVLVDALGWASQSLPARPPIMALGCLKLDVADGTLRVSAFDYENSSAATVDLATSSGEGTVVVPGRLVVDIVRSLPGETVKASLEGTRLVLTSETSRFSLPTIPDSEYPDLPPVPTGLGTVDGAVLLAAVRQVAVAAGSVDTLPVLTAISVHMDPSGTWTLAATDRYRLAVRKIAFTPGTITEEQTLLIPAKVLSDFARALDKRGEITFGATPGEAGVFGIEVDGLVGSTRLVSGDYPKYARLLPEAFAAEATVDTAELVQVVNRVKLAAVNKVVRLDFDVDGLTVSAGRADEDTAATENVAMSYEGDRISVAFNHDYLLAGLKSVGTDTAQVLLNSATKPAVLRPVGVADDYTYLLMPVRHA